MNISLIANSGIQFYKFGVSINPAVKVIPTMGFYESRDLKDEKTAKYSLQYAYYLPEEDIWMPKQILKFEGYLNENDSLQEDRNFQVIRRWQLKEDIEYYTINDIVGVLGEFLSTETETKWLPVPYFKKNASNQSLFGPIAWCRMVIKDSGDGQYHITLSFDTKTASSESAYFSPRDSDTLEDANYFGLSGNEDLNLHFCDREFGCEWVERYIQSVSKNKPAEFPYLKQLAKFLYMVKYLEALKAFPDITLYADNVTPIEVFLMLDIGNSNTCGLLFENKNPRDFFNFDNVKPLKLNDLSFPERDYDDPFAMRLAFAEMKFGDINIPGFRNFKWPSLLRLGKEAERLINKYNIDPNKNVETATNNSSPKRYLWDNNKAEVQWEFINFKGRNLREAIYYEGISEQFKEDGEYAYDGAFSFSPHYSRKSLMTFVYIEILLHAISQVNSFEFRNFSGNPERPRKIKKIAITCPTSIIQREQIILRECAAVAVRTLGRFFSNTFLGEYNESDGLEDIEVIPEPKNLAKKLDQVSLRKDWIYDEATCGQLAFLYAEISKRFLNNTDLFFSLYGKKRDDVVDVNQNVLTIGSVDIGGGTTDLMICAYEYEKGQKNSALIRPNPLYWESFNMAGDDLLKEIIQQIILEGSPKSPDEEGCTGILFNSAKAAGVKDVAEKMHGFFGPNTARLSHIARVYRKNFIVQVAIPIATRYLQHVIELKPDTWINFQDFFEGNQPNPEVVNFFNTEFAPLKIENIKWKLSATKVSSIVESTFDVMLKQLSAILAAYGCDFVLLAGKPTTLPKIREMFVRYFPVSPDRIITLNNYRIGTWYPGANDLGYVKFPKTIVSVGALIALMSGRTDRLRGFKLKIDLLCEKLISTADYLGAMNPFTQNLDQILISPETNQCELEITNLPLKIGYKQLPNKNYISKPIYKLEVNEAEIKRRLENDPELAADEGKMQKAMEQRKNILVSHMPLKLTIQRNLTESKELLTITQILNRDNEEISRNTLLMTIMTLPDEQGYWLDTGVFLLNIK